MDLGHRSGIAVGLLALLVGTCAHAAVAISMKPTRNMNCSADVCTPTAKNAVLNVNDLAAMLASGDVKVTTGAGAVAIGVTAPLTWASSSHLTLDAALNVSIRSPVVIEGTAGLTIVTNDGGSGGDLLFIDQGKIDFWDTASSLVINGNTYTLAADLPTLSALIAGNPAGNYALANDVDLSASRPLRKVPIPTAFTGRFEGLAHTIANLTIKDYDKSGRIGLFSDLEAPAIVRDVRINKIKIITGNQVSSVGALSAYSASGATISGVSANGTLQVYGTNQTSGGLVGTNLGAISNASTNVRVQGQGTLSHLGGLIGLNSGSIDASFSSGPVTGEAEDGEAGGLAGGNTGTISNSHASGSVDVAGSASGGLVGENDATIDGSYAAGAVNQNASSGAACSDSSNFGMGGLVGVNKGQAIHNSYATGSVTAVSQNCVGGLVGFYVAGSGVSIASAYATGALSAGDSPVGGFLGAGAVGLSVTQGYWDIDTTGTDSAESDRKSVNGVTGLTDSQFKAGLPDGFDPNVWGQNAGVNGGYPYLLNNPPQ